MATPHLGIIDGLLAGAFVGQGLVGAGLYLWGRALHSRLAGMAAAVLAASLLPVAVLGRTLTFYPVIVGVLTLSTGMVAVAWRWRGLRTALLGGIGVALALLIDPRGLLWGLSLGGILLVAVLLRGWDRKPRRGLTRVVLGLAAVSLPIWLAWTEADRAYPVGTTTLEALGDPVKGWETRIPIRSDPNVPMTPASGYVWGQSPLSHIPDTLRFLRRQSKRTPDEVRLSERTLSAKAHFLTPYMSWAVGGLLLAMVALVRRPGRLLLLLGTAVPFVVVLQGAVDMRYAGLRFLGNGMVCLPLWIGLGIATLAGAGARQTPLRTLAVLGLLLTTVLGVLPTDLSPAAAWRKPLNASPGSSLASTERGHNISQNWPQCVVRVVSDQKKGQPQWLHSLPPTTDAVPRRR